MRIVHLYSNWKWTGPAEPAVNLAAGLARRGHDVTFIPGKPVGALANQIAEKARERGLTVLTGLTLDKHYRPFANLADRRRLSKWLADLQPDIVHCHTLNDHLVGGSAAKRLRLPPPVVRSFYDGEIGRRGIRTWRTFTKMTSWLISASDRVRKEIVARYGLDPERTSTVDVAVDRQRFDRSRELPDLRSEYGIGEDDFVVGIVARMQPTRRFDVFFDGINLAARDIPNLRVLVVGRGTHMEQVAVRRAQETTIADRIEFTGYRDADEFVGTLALMDAKIFLWPGSDGSCRAVREAMSMGLPVIAADVGMLSEIVTDGVDGLLVPHDAKALAAAIRRLASDRAECRRMAARAAETAARRFDLQVQVDDVLEVYGKLIGSDGRNERARG